MTDTTEPEPTVTEPEDAGCEAIPDDLVELHEAIEWQDAVRARAAEAAE